MTKTITFVDIDETVFNTYAKIGVLKGEKVVKRLSNQEFNNYKLKKGEKFNFDEFKSAELFNKTSKPIQKMVRRITITINRNVNTNNKVIFLTARSDFDNKNLFLETFRKVGIEMNDPNVYVERSGNMVEIPTVALRKEAIIKKYLEKGNYNIVKMIDDDYNNLEYFYRACSGRNLKVVPLLAKKDGSVEKIDFLGENNI